MSDPLPPTGITLIGTGVFVRKNNQILMFKRKGGAQGQGTWGLVGGHLLFGETPEHCAKREVFEEAGIKIKNIQYGPYLSTHFKGTNRHYITLFLVCDLASGEAKIMEPDRQIEMRWVEWEKLPKNLFLPLKKLVETGFNPFKI